jgi:hypothetical protein
VGPLLFFVFICCKLLAQCYNSSSLRKDREMNPEKKREFTPYAFGIAYAEANPWVLQNHYTVEEVASTFYTPKSKSWIFFVEGFTKVKERIER